MPRRNDIQKILVIGSGPIVIGQSAEFDYSGTQAVKALRADGYEVVLVNSNPATIMTDPELADRTYIEPLTRAYLEEIIKQEAEMLREESGSAARSFRTPDKSGVPQDDVPFFGKLGMPRDDVSFSGKSGGPQDDRPGKFALLPTVGGQTALNLAVELADSGVLEKYGVELIGAQLRAIKMAEDRLLFKDAFTRL